MQTAKRAQKRAQKRKALRVKKQELRERIQELSADLGKSFKLRLTLRVLRNLYWSNRANEFIDKISCNKEYKPAKKLSFEERQYIYLWRNEGMKKAEIARRLKRSRSTITRELSRNWLAIQKYRQHPYDAAKFAQDLTKRRGSVKRQKVRIKDLALRKAIEQGLKEDLTPELISQRILIDFCKTISHEAIYQWIYAERRDLICYLTRAGQKYHNRSSKRRRRALLQPASPKTSIDQRPMEANDRLEFGHWEFDTIVSRQSSECLLVIQERLSRYFFVVKLKSCTAAEVSKAIISCLQPLGAYWVKSLTCDNGPENWCQDQLTAALGVVVYYCHPYCASERGGVENRNGMIRWFFPKKTNFSLVHDDEVEKVRQILLNRPMKCLNYFTPQEIFSGQYQPIFKMAA